MHAAAEFATVSARQAASVFAERLLLGQDAYQRATHKLGALRENFETWQILTQSTGFEA